MAMFPSHSSSKRWVPRSRRFSEFSSRLHATCGVVFSVATGKSLFTPAFYGMTLGTPSQHAAHEVGDVTKPGPLQDHHGLCRARPGTADGDHGPVRCVLCDLRGPAFEFAQRDQP